MKMGYFEEDEVELDEEIINDIKKVKKAVLNEELVTH